MLLGRHEARRALACARRGSRRTLARALQHRDSAIAPQVSGPLETIRREKEQRLIKDGCTGELWGTIKPDIVLHATAISFRCVLILDFKFPCPHPTHQRGRGVGAESAFPGANQGRIYEEALGGETLMLTPQEIK